MVCALVGIASWFLGSPSAYGQPSLSAVSPAAVRPGQTIEVTLSGGKLADPLKVWTSFPAKVELAASQGDTSKRGAVKCKITTPADTPVGIGAIAAANPSGASNVVLMLVDDLPSVADNGKNHSPKQSQQIKPPVAIDGASQSGASDFYQFTAKKGQRLSFEVFGARLASNIDAVIWLRDAGGAELGYSDDDPGLGSDCRLSHTFEKDGQYTLEVRDNRYQNGHRYRLRIGDFPLVGAPLPSGVRQGSTAQVTFPALAGDSAEPLIVQAPYAAKSSASETGAGVSQNFGRFDVAARRKGGDSAAFVSLSCSNLPEVLEPNGEAAENPNQTASTGAASSQGAAVVLPCAITGRLVQPGERDSYSFVAKKGDRFVFRSLSRALHSPILTRFTIHKADLADSAASDQAQLAASPVTNNEDESLTYTFPADGDYSLAVEDLLQRGGPDFVYRIEIRRGGAFQLNVRSDKNGRDKFTVHPRGAFGVEVQAARDGFNGPITLSATTSEGKPLHVYNHLIAEKQKATQLVVCLPPDAKPGDLEMIRIHGQAIVSGRPVTQSATSLGLLRTRWPQTPFPPSWLDGLMTASRVTATPNFYTAELTQPVAYFARGVGKANFTVKLNRNDKNFKAALIVSVDGLPPSMSYSVKRNGNGPQETYDIMVTGPADSLEGSQRLRIMTFGVHGGNGRQFIFDQATLSVVTPLKVRITPAGAITAGGKQKVKVAVERFLGNQAFLELNDPRFGKVKINVERLGAGSAIAPQPVSFKWKSLPGKVSGGDFTLAPDQNEIEVELSAAADAPATKFTSLTVEAKTKFLEHNVSVVSPAAALEVKPAAKKPPANKGKK